MSFNSPTFVFFFAPLVFGIYYAAPIRWKNLTLLLLSFVFYAWAEPIFIFIAVASSVIDYWLVSLLAPKPPGSTERRVLTGIAVAQGILLLVYFKYSAFLYGLVAELVGFEHTAPALLSPALPLAISFLTFEKITYVVDNYRAIAQPARSMLDYLTYVFMFPKLIAGPIVKYQDIEPYITKHAVRVGDFRIGILRFAQGMAKKVLIADGLASTVETAFRAPPDALTSGDAWLGALCFGFQIYFDFSGYSDMAIGMARMMGFPLRENFNQPYLAPNFTEFWHRWNISLSTWIREYLYISLGGNRVPMWRVYINLVVCFVASGLWHGANLTFLLWGLYHGAFLVADRAGLKRITRALPCLISVGTTFILVTIGWIFFRSPNIDHAFGYLHALVDMKRDLPPLLFLDQNIICILAAASAMSFTPECWVRTLSPSAALAKAGAATLSWLIAFGFIWASARLVASTYNAFLYFRF